MNDRIFIEASAESLFKHGEELCGDKVEIVRNDDSVIVVLADGLGSGVKANILASLTSKIIATMVDGGAEIVETVETVASTLPISKDRGVAYSTFTLLHIYHDGHATLVEYDNPAAVILRRGKPLELEKQEMVVGDKRILTCEFTLEAQDIVVLFSDGVVHAGVGKVLDLGWQWPNIRDYLVSSYTPECSAMGLTKRLLAACDSLYMSSPGDDTTVVSVKVRTPVPACIMVGPPVDSAKDEEVVKKLLACPGKKVVCGGTTSQIVSRVTGKRIDVALEYYNPSVPPMAKIEGIDLVTEGVLTLGRALDDMKEYCAAGSEMKDVLNINKRDGASLLAKLLLEQCTQAHFLVGRAMNPAHQNRNLPLSLSLKLRLVEDIAECLRSLGKKATIEYN